MIDCKDCKHSIPAYHSLLCRALNLPKPVEYMRDDRSQCGLKGDLFEAKTDRRYSEYDYEQS